MNRIDPGGGGGGGGRAGSVGFLTEGGRGRRSSRGGPRVTGNGTYTRNRALERYQNCSYLWLCRSRATFYRLEMETDRSEGGSRLAKVRIIPSFFG